MSPTVCVNCTCDLHRGRTFGFRTSRGEVLKCLACALLHWPMVRRSLLTALVVGTLLTLLNQGDIIFSASWQSGLYWKVPLTYCVPFMVATWGAMSNGRR